MENHVEPGIDVRTEILVKRNDDDVRGMRITDIFDMDIETDEWIPIDTTNKKISVVGFHNSFFEVEEVYIRETFPGESLVEIIAGYKKRVVVSNIYPCIVIDKDGKMLGIKSARSMTINDLVPISRTLQIHEPESYHEGASGILHLLEKEKTSHDLKDYYVGRKVEEIASINAETGYFARTSKPSKTVPRQVTTGYLNVDTQLIRFKLKHSEYIATSSGVLLHT